LKNPSSIDEGFFVLLQQPIQPAGAVRRPCLASSHKSSGFLFWIGQRAT